MGESCSYFQIAKRGFYLENFQIDCVSNFQNISKSLLASKKLLVEDDRELLRKLNKKECDVLVGRWTSQEFVRVIMEFWKKK